VIVGGQGRVLGCCGVNQISKEDRSANFGYWVRTSETGRGVATQAGRLLAAWAFAHTNLVRLEIVAAVGNDASLAVAGKLGALREGVLRSRLLIHGTFHDAVVLSLIRPRAA
jgi:RimJ/RimL family protein N-acetyltransferase